jgi:hypothetical protein
LLISVVALKFRREQVVNAPLSAADLASRAPVWEALAEFWLDTELVDYQFDYIARIIAASPYSIEEVQAIHDYEVAPAVSANLACVAGEWAGFDQAWLEARCLACAARRGAFWYRLRIGMQRPFFRRFTKHYWEQITPRLQALQRAPETATKV